MFAQTIDCSRALHLRSFNPSDIGRASLLLGSGAILGRRFQPYESHVPFLLQVKVRVGNACTRLSAVLCVVVVVGWGGGGRGRREGEGGSRRAVVVARDQSS